VLAEYSNQNAKYYESKDALNNDLAKILDEYKSQSIKLTVKGDRSFKMEEVVKFVKENL
ncbi:UDP-N-acetylmuramoylalanyl-D-glutamyl-2, 6-diaminopimelate--D-alanyl-D-alanine ligase, partial [Francisella tularensis subsp. holarctica]|nr:UDP-N-acetylmuramoylalanyl-D-glutamyl-2, 6-diaminopimelate--D-alanyl-D-alanine ligase [Francisella tularensis subsp. holarctica]